MNLMSLVIRRTYLCSFQHNVDISYKPCCPQKLAENCLFILRCLTFSPIIDRFARTAVAVRHVCLNGLCVPASKRYISLELVIVPS